MDAARKALKRGSWLFVVGSVLACSPAPRDGGVVVSQQVTVVIASGPDKGTQPPGIDLADPRIAVAERELKRMLGHALVFELDSALVPSFDHSLHPVFVEALERTVTQLQYLNEQYPDAFTFAKANLAGVRWAYAPTQSPPDPTLDRTNGILAILVSSDRPNLIKNGEVVEALLDALELDRMERYAAMSGERVPLSEAREYFTFQSHYHRPRPNAPKLSSNEVELVRIGNVLALYPRLTDPALRKDADEWLAMMGSHVRDAFASQKDVAAAERAQKLRPVWLGWLNRAGPGLDAGARERIAELFFERRSAGASDAFRRGFDTLGFAGPPLDAWLSHSDARDDDSRDRAERSVICPYTFSRDHSTISGYGYCNGSLYVDVFDGTDGPKRLAELLVRRKNERLTATAALHVMRRRGVPALLELLGAFDADEQASRAALSALAAYPRFGSGGSLEVDEVPLDPAPLFERIPAWWKSHPARRPLLLLVLVQLSDRYRGVVAWSKLPEYLGGRIDAAELSAFLDTSPRAVSALLNLADSLSAGWRRSPVVIPKLERWLKNDAQNRGDGPEAYYATERVADFLCRAGTKADLAELQTFLKKRIEAFPEERNNLEKFATDRLSELCPKVHDQKPADKPILFGDDG